MHPTQDIIMRRHRVDQGVRLVVPAFGDLPAEVVVVEQGDAAVPIGILRGLADEVVVVGAGVLRRADGDRLVPKLPEVVVVEMGDVAVRVGHAGVPPGQIVLVAGGLAVGVGFGLLAAHRVVGVMGGVAQGVGLGDHVVHRVVGIVGLREGFQQIDAVGRIARPRQVEAQRAGAVGRDHADHLPVGVLVLGVDLRAAHILGGGRAVAVPGQLGAAAPRRERAALAVLGNHQELPAGGDGEIPHRRIAAARGRVGGVVVMFLRQPVGAVRVGLDGAEHAAHGIDDVGQRLRKRIGLAHQFAEDVVGVGGRLVVGGGLADGLSQVVQAVGGGVALGVGGARFRVSELCVRPQVNRKIRSIFHRT